MSLDRLVGRTSLPTHDCSCAAAGSRATPGRPGVKTAVSTRTARTKATCWRCMDSPRVRVEGNCNSAGSSCPLARPGLQVLATEFDVVCPLLPQGLGTGAAPTGRLPALPPRQRLLPVPPPHVVLGERLVGAVAGVAGVHHAGVSVRGRQAGDLFEQGDHLLLVPLSAVGPRQSELG